MIAHLSTQNQPCNHLPKQLLFLYKLHSHILMNRSHIQSLISSHRMCLQHHRRDLRCTYSCFRSIWLLIQAYLSKCCSCFQRLRSLMSHREHSTKCQHCNDCWFFLLRMHRQMVAPCPVQHLPTMQAAVLSTEHHAQPHDCWHHRRAC